MRICPCDQSSRSRIASFYHSLMYDRMISYINKIFYSMFFYKLPCIYCTDGISGRWCRHRMIQQYNTFIRMIQMIYFFVDILPIYIKKHIMHNRPVYLTGNNVPRQYLIQSCMFCKNLMRHRHFHKNHPSSDTFLRIYYFIPSYILEIFPFNTKH